MRMKLAYARIIPYVCIILAVAGVYFYVGYAIEENNQREIRQEIKRLMDLYECEPR